LSSWETEVKNVGGAIIKFFPVEMFVVPRGKMFTGPCPLDGTSDATNIRKFVGRHVEINGEVYSILAVETYAKFPPPGLGEPIGILVESKK
jgi:hypothetical protein